MNLLKRVVSKLKIYFLTLLKSGKFRRNIRNTFSSNLINFLEYSYWLRLYKIDRSLIKKVEKLRLRTRSAYENESVITFTSPKSGESLFDESGSVKAGKINISTKGSFSRTGTGPKTGIQLKKITEAFGANHILELGTNTGLSGCYFLAADNEPYLTTIEGSEKMCVIAEENLSEVSDKFEVINGMFDEVLERLISNNRKFDLAFLDGQHEEKATIYYASKLKKLLNPNGIILFDDIFWSEGMHNAWMKVIDDSDFDMIIGLRTRGVVRVGNSNKKVIFHIVDYLGHQGYHRKGH